MFAKYVLLQGRLALGIMVGIITTFLVLTLCTRVSLFRALPDEAYYSLLGATIAASIGIVGQLIVVISNEAAEAREIIPSISMNYFSFYRKWL